jgi:hypothetical protein
LGGPKTFRRASTKILGKWGSNLQNIEKSMREIYISDGYTNSVKDKCKYWLQTGDTSVFTEEELNTIRVFVQVDQSGAEALIVAYDCIAGDYRKLFIHGIKPHVYVGLKLFADKWYQEAIDARLTITEDDILRLSMTKIEDLKKNPAWTDTKNLIASSDNWPSSRRYYYHAKQTCHSANYGIEASTFIMNILEKSAGKVVLSREQGEYFLNTYRALFPEIVERCQRIEEQAKKYRMLYNMFGFPYTITSYEVTKNIYKELYAWGAQSTVAEITRIAYSRMQEFIEAEKKKWDILADTHDSYLLQCPLLDVKECSTKAKEFMNQRLVSPIDNTEFNMKSECNIGFNWSPFKKEVNEVGLQEIQW